LPHGRINPTSSIPFFAIHLLPLLVIFTGVSRTAWILFAVTFWTRMFFITGGYHRYFSHKAYKTSRVFQFILGYGGCTAAQKGPLWWAGHHRIHHRFADTINDPHTPRKGFWWSHAGWILSDDTTSAPLRSVKDFEKFPELRFISKHDWIAPWSLAVVCTLIGGWSGLLIGFVLSTVVLWHATFLINSLAHVFGSRRFETEDTSRNNALLAILTMGEGWHNNHHKAAYLARQGTKWWEIDITWYVLFLLEKLHIIWGVKRPRTSSRIKAGPSTEVIDDSTEFVDEALAQAVLETESAALVHSGQAEDSTAS
jgi:stearoyl-CoA desaturase (delta-9 desaturase)